MATEKPSTQESLLHREAKVNRQKNQHFGQQKKIPNNDLYLSEMPREVLVDEMM
jgi:hypothetical protein